MSAALRIASYPTITIGADDAKLQQLRNVASKFIDATAEGDKTLEQIYPEHIYDPLRRVIAVEIAGKELAKLIDAEDNDRLSDIREATRKLYEGRAGVYASVHDFWSLVEMILHIKKKELPELITAENVTWTREHMALDDLYLTSMPFLAEHPDIFGPKPWNLGDVRTIFNDQPKVFNERSQRKKGRG